MAEAEAMQPTADRRAVHPNVVKPRQFQAQLIQGQITPIRQAPAYPRRQPGQLAGAAQITLLFWRKTARFRAQIDHVIDEFR